MNPKLLESAEFYRRRYHNFATVLIVPLVILIIFIGVFLCFAKKEITVISQGEVAPTKVLAVIQSVSDTSIAQNKLDDNTKVDKGDLLVQYTENAEPEQKDAQKNIIKDRNKRLDKEIEKEEKKTKKKYKKLSKKERKKREKKDQKKKEKKKKDRDAEDKKETDHVSLFAPESGVIHTNSKYEGLNILPKWSEIAQIYPDIQKTKTVLITYYVSSDDVVSMEKGQKTRLSLERKGNDKLMIEGKINSVASSATSTKKGNLFKVTAKVKLSKKDSKLVKYGMTGKTVTVIDKKTYFDYFKDKLLHKVED
ncbi:HlyD family efflux transporter periplasmic adaptor subunit [Streptococcus sobrinus]|uniref:Bacteriocin secretion accessory protein n=1 Tax=Streptococcus sobrinus W1703 TaxID=1227275 RepID=U2KJW5_9STRE|nr:HlyD family efflux transporter periplasmic adaptor subunit [Streptococcus sobrinus]ERJ77504.1 bacteriocin secretion accessory protein [Streptococcus sobrinus W1703]OZV21894.1 competence protein ComB [Streptococcus sobrinus]